MTGGMAFIYDKAGTFKDRANPATLEIVRIANDHWAQKLHGLVEEHAKQTESALALRLLNEWDVEIGNFWQVVPTEIIPTLDKPIDNGQALEQTA
jgi:glutamate synthase (NADPH/NADH) large chain